MIYSGNYQINNCFTYALENWASVYDQSNIRIRIHNIMIGVYLFW